MKEKETGLRKIIKFIFSKIKKGESNLKQPSLINSESTSSNESLVVTQLIEIQSNETEKDKEIGDNVVSSMEVNQSDQHLVKNPMCITESLIAVSSVTIKELNRDFFAEIANEKLKIRGVAVADGIGTNEKVEQASLFVIEFIKQYVEILKPSEELNLEKAFEDCKTRFDERFDKEINNIQFGTTLILAMEYFNKGKGKIKTAYVGNGAIWHIKGNFSQFSENQKIPWNCINYLNPNCIEENGKEVLSNCISLGVNNYLGPNIIEFSLDPEFGDIIMICTDGIYSYDQLVFSEDGFGEIWVRYEVKMRVFYRYLTDYFKQGDCNKETLNKMLRNYLNELKELNLLDDDATLGLIISTKAMEYQKGLYNGATDKNQ